LKGCLEILLESAQVPNQQTLAAFVRQLIRLRAAPIKQVKLYVRQTGEEIPVGVRNLNWQHNRCLCHITAKSSELAQQGM